MSKINKANLVSQATAEKLKLLKDWLPLRFQPSDFDVITRGKEQWVRLKPKPPENNNGGGGAGGACPLGQIFEDGEDTKLLGGTVTGGITVEIVTPITLDLGSVDNTWLWLTVIFEANAEDDVLLPGVASITSVTPANGTSIPDNELPTNIAPTGTIHIPLGYYFSGAFIPSACGLITINHCPGTISYTRA